MGLIRQLCTILLENLRGRTGYAQTLILYRAEDVSPSLQKHNHKYTKFYHQHSLG